MKTQLRLGDEVWLPLPGDTLPVHNNIYTSARQPMVCNRQIRAATCAKELLDRERGEGGEAAWVVTYSQEEHDSICSNASGDQRRQANRARLAPGRKAGARSLTVHA